MNNIPIIFSAPMVRALLEGRKTMTRRVLKPQPEAYQNEYCTRLRFSNRKGREIGDASPDLLFDGSCPAAMFARYAVGDRLWVRESLKHITSDPVSAMECDLHCYVASIPAGMDSANPYEDNYLFPEDGTPNLKPKSTPSIHMPRWASRLTLIVTGVKVERLQDISSDDCIAEGEGRPVGTELVYGSVTPAWNIRAFSALWSNLHGDASWEENPFVVAISFRVIKSNIDAPAARIAA